MVGHRRSAVRLRLILIGLAALAVAAIVIIAERPHKPIGAVTGTRAAPQRQSGAAHAPARVRRPRDDVSGSTVGRMLGQMIVARFDGPTPSRSFLGRIRHGQIGGVILFADNLQSDSMMTRALTGKLQSAARQGGNPPLLIMTDQEGGIVRRVPGPPDLAPSDMDTPSIAYEQGRAAGSLLRSVGVNVDLAPVADVEVAPGSFLGTRAFGSSPTLVAARACAFAKGLASRGVGYTLKHFPGLGQATTSTDNAPVSIDVPAALLRSEYLAYRRCGADPMALVMVSSAIYPALTGPRPAVMSPLTYHRELRRAVPQTGVVTISDDLQTPALADQPAPAHAAIDAGLDLALYAGTEDGSAEAYRVLKEDVSAGRIDAHRLGAADQAIARLKRAITQSSTDPG